jgi:hypothetical protein
MTGSSKIAVEKDRPGQPHQGKVFVAVHAHLDDVPYFAASRRCALADEATPVISSVPATTRNTAGAPSRRTS